MFAIGGSVEVGNYLLDSRSLWYTITKHIRGSRTGEEKTECGHWRGRENKISTYLHDVGTPRTNVIYHYAYTKLQGPGLLPMEALALLTHPPYICMENQIPLWYMPLRSGMRGRLRFVWEIGGCLGSFVARKTLIWCMADAEGDVAFLKRGEVLTQLWARVRMGY